MSKDTNVIDLDDIVQQPKAIIYQKEKYIMHVPTVEELVNILKEAKEFEESTEDDSDPELIVKNFEKFMASNFKEFPIEKCSEMQVTYMKAIVDVVVQANSEGAEDENGKK